MSCVTKDDRGKWVAEVEIEGELKVSPPLRTKKEGYGWIEGKILDSKVGDEGQRLMSAAIVKGIIEKKDGTAYFGSTISFTHHIANAVKFGLITQDRKVTKRGKEWYERCLKNLSQRRQVNWYAEGGVGLPNPNIEN